MRSTVFFIFILSIDAFAGGSSSGGTPPGRRELLEQIMIEAPGIGGLFEDQLTGERGLIVNIPLDTQLIISMDPILTDIRLPTADFDSLVTRKGTLDVIGIDGTNRSYFVNDGLSPGSLVLKDLRELIRSGETGVLPVK